MIEVLKQTEAVPAHWPAVPDGLSPEAAALDPGMVWGRIEAYLAHRWSAREVVWIIEGESGDEWMPPLGPLVSWAAAHWSGTAWVAMTLEAGPLGLVLPASGTFRVTATIGADDATPQAPVLEAYRRLAEYMAEEVTRHGVASHSLSEGNLSENFERMPAWRARALQYSGAADLLRPYRRA